MFLPARSATKCMPLSKPLSVYMASSNLHRDEGSSLVLFVWFVLVFSPWIVGVRLRPNELLSLPSLGLEAYIKLSPVSLTLESGYKSCWWIRAMCSVRRYRYRKWSTSTIKRSNCRNSLTSVVQRRATSVCGSGKSLTIMLGGYPDTTTKTLKHRSSRKNETRLRLWMTETIVRLRNYRYTHNPYKLSIQYNLFQ